VPRVTLTGDTGLLNVYILSAWGFALPAEFEDKVLDMSERHVMAQRSGAQIYVYEWTGNALTEVSNVPH
jgi:hypothetical protein